MRAPLDIDGAQDIRTQRQAEEAAVGVVSQFTAVRAVSATAGPFTVGTRAARVASAAQDGDRWFETDTLWEYYSDGVSWHFLGGLYIASEATRTGLTISTVDNGAVFFVTDTLILWQVASGSWTKRLEVKGTANQISATIVSGVLTLSLPASVDISGHYDIGGQRVVGARGAAIADADGTLGDATRAINQWLSQARDDGKIDT